jgi:hypothetical protein
MRAIPFAHAEAIYRFGSGESFAVSSCFVFPCPDCTAVVI